MASNPENPRRKTSIPPSISSYNPHSPQNPYTPVFSYLPPTPSSPLQSSSTSGFFLDATPKPVSPTTPINDWNMHDVMLGDAGYVVKDEIAMRAVDGFTGLEQQPSSEEIKPSVDEKLMNDAPSFKTNNKRALRSIASSAAELKSHQCTILQYIWPFQETPGWFVDLQEEQEVSGIILYTGAHGKCKCLMLMSVIFD